ncbi:MAG: DUF4444 domain-containing protein [Paracoccaceae bacterium]|jgi:biotin-(acetyl-CoA carboxylase) ligase
MTELTLPPLFTAHGVPAGHEVPATAIAQAVLGCDAGSVFYQITKDRLSCAIVFAPEIPLPQAAIVLPLCAVGFQNALGVLAPPEVAVHLEWTGGVRINGAKCGTLTLHASDSEGTPDWSIVHLTLPLWPDQDDLGHTPDQTALFAEGCVDVDPHRLLEAWVRHILVWISEWEGGDTRNLHSTWRGLAHNIGEEIDLMNHHGAFVGLDEDFGALMRMGDTTTLIPLTTLIQEAS